MVFYCGGSKQALSLSLAETRFHLPRGACAALFSTSLTLIDFHARGPYANSVRDYLELEMSNRQGRAPQMIWEA